MTTHPPTETVRTRYGNCPKCGYEFMAENEVRDFGCGMCGHSPSQDTTVEKDELLTNSKKISSKLVVDTTVDKWEREYMDLAHAYFEPGDKSYWDGIEFGKDFIRHSLQQAREEERERARGEIKSLVKKHSIRCSRFMRTRNTQMCNCSASSFNSALRKISDLLTKEEK